MFGDIVLCSNKVFTRLLTSGRENEAAFNVHAFIKFKTHGAVKFLMS